MTGTPGFAAAQGTNIALRSTTTTSAGNYDCVLYQDVAIPVGATTATFSGSWGVKFANGLAPGHGAAFAGIYSTNKVPNYLDATVAGTRQTRVPGVADAAFATFTDTFNVSALAGTTVRVALHTVSDQNEGSAVTGFDNIQLLVTTAYRVTYNGNGNTGGTVPVDAATYANGATVTVKANTGTLVKTGFTFAGWNTAADGSGTTYPATGSATFLMGGANVTLFAKWTAVPTYSVTYNGNGNTSGIPPADVATYATGATVTVKANNGVPPLARTGFTFNGWNTAADGSGTSYAATGAVTFLMGAANVTLFAQWTPVVVPTYTVTYNGNGNTGGTVPVDGNTYQTEATVTVKANTGTLTRTNYVFNGWNTAANGSGTSYPATGAATFMMGNANVTLYARWSLVSVPGTSPTGSGSITASFTSGDTGCGFTSQQFIPLTGNPASPPAGTAPAGVAFPHGLFNFTVSGCSAPGATLVFSLVYPQALPAGTQFWKYGRTAADPTPHWYVLPASISGTTATFTIVDGGLGDDDLTANASITDPGGPGMSPVVPTMGEWAMILMALLLLTAGALTIRRRAPGVPGLG